LVALPFKSKEERAKYMRKYRKKQKIKLDILAEKHPDIFKAIFGEKQKKK